jgi:Protein of unknown function (DUF402)
MPPWQAGDTVVLRYHNHRGRPTGALPTRVVSGEGPVLWLPAGTRSKWPGLGDRGIRELSLEERFTIPWEPLDSSWWGEGVLIVGRPGRAHAMWLFQADGAFAGWYVNLEDAWRLWRLGFDTEDHTLDVWIEADGVWRRTRTSSRWQWLSASTPRTRHWHFAGRARPCSRSGRFRRAGKTGGPTPRGRCRPCRPTGMHPSSQRRLVASNHVRVHAPDIARSAVVRLVGRRR